MKRGCEKAKDISKLIECCIDPEIGAVYGPTELDRYFNAERKFKRHEKKKY